MDENINYIEHYLRTEEPALFETACPLTEKAIADFRKFSNKTLNTPSFVTVIASGVFMILLGVLMVVLGTLLFVFQGVFDIMIGIAAIYSLVGNSKNNAKRSLDESGYKDIIKHCKFYRDAFLYTDNFNMGVMPYNMLYAVHETDEYFYVLKTKKETHVIPKDSFTLGTPEELRKMLAAKLGDRFVPHCK